MKNWKILVIEDDHQIVSMVQLYLEKKGIQVTATFDGDQGLNAFRQEPVDLVITDLLMPEVDGFDVIKALVAQPTPPRIIAITAEHRLVDEALAAGAEVCLKKPFKLAELLEVISRLLSGPQA